MFTKESLERLRERVDLLEVISSHVEVKRAGSTYKALCPFHQEKTPSFIIQKGDGHYHCFGCGAHGDAIQFLMNYLHLSFVEAVESLAERFGVLLEEAEKKDAPIDKAALREACLAATRFFHAYLLYSPEGKEPLAYLFKRGLTIDFIRRFEVGFAPEGPDIFFNAMEKQGILETALIDTGLVNEKRRPFFRDRICFPIHNSFGQVVGFSARKFKEATFGGKYINTAETALFKKSRILFGMHVCKKRISKEKKALIVEGQIDCLKLIEMGLNLTVSALGTAFGDSHAHELEKLGVRKVYLLFDGDEAGLQAASKVGHLFQKKGIEVKVPLLPKDTDPDLFVSQAGMEKLIDVLESAKDYLSFQIDWMARELDIHTAAGKAELVKRMKKQIEEWQEPVMIHESLKKLAAYLNLPSETVGAAPTDFYVKKKEPSLFHSVDPNRILELDLLRWLILLAKERPAYTLTVCHNLQDLHFWTASCRKLFQNFLEAKEKDLLSICAEIEEPTLIDEILQKKVNMEKADTQLLETIQKLLDRQWMQTREEIKMQIHSGNKSEKEIFELAKQFDELKKNRPQAKWIPSNT